MEKLKALLLTEGMHGMISQVEGMAKALEVEYSHKIVRLAFPWNLIPPKFSPISQIVLKNKIYTANDETPDLVISCGRKSVIPSIFLKKMNSKIFTIHIQNPKVSFKNFDVIVAPEHDNLKEDNTYSSKGAIHYITDNEIPDLIISCGRKSVIPSILLKRKNLKIFTIHIQDPKVNLKNFDAIVAPEHDNLKGDNIYTSKGAIHYITELEINKAEQYLSDKIEGEKIVSLILGGPNKYYSFNSDQIINIFNKIKSIFVSDGYKVIIIPSMRTPKETIDLAIKEMGSCGHVVNKVDKQAYLSAYALANYVIVTCDSTSMISEAAITGKPVYVVRMNHKRSIHRFKKFYELFKDLGITRDLNNTIEHWSYDSLNEVERAALLVKERMKKNGII